MKTRIAKSGAPRGALLFLLAVFALSGCQNQAGSSAEVSASPAATTITEPETDDKPEIKRYPRWSTKNWENYPTLREDSAVRSKPQNIPKFAKIVGDPENGRKIVADRKRGGCIACHIIPGHETPGNVGPPLINYEDWGRTDQWIVGYIFDARSQNPATVMPPWGANGILTMQEIQDIVVYLKSLQGNWEMPEGLDNPFLRPLPNSEARDNMDPTINPGMFVLDDAEVLFAQKGKAGKACLECHENPATSLRGATTRYPRWDKDAKKILGIEEFVVLHAKQETGADWPMQSDENLAMSIYVRSFSNGMPIQLDTTSPEARASLLRGRALVTRKIGQFDFSCLDCHATSANRWIRGQFLGGQRGQIAHFPTWRTSRGEIWDIRKRFQWCNLSVRSNPLEPEAPEYSDLELYLTSLSNGLVIDVPGIRH